MVKDHPFIQKVEHSKNNVPSIILYSDEQMTDFNKIIGTSKEPRVGIDRTFNLENVYVTSSVYKNERVIRIDSSDHPVFLGPVFLHKEANFHNYYYFLSHISAKLASSISDIDVILPTQIEVGSDDEKTLTKAIDVVFSNSKRSLCTKHLKYNITYYLKNKISIKIKDRIHLIDLIFGEQGILNSSDTFQFEERCSQLLTNANTPDFYNYYERTMKPTLELNYKNLGRECLNAANRWKYNNAESINNIMKLDTNWKAHSTPALINLLADMIKLQQLDLQRALYNSGNYRLFGYKKKCCILEDIFRAKTPEDQNKYFVKFLNSNVSSPTPSSVYVTSTDGTYSVINKAAGVAKKPGQRKQPVNAKTSKRH